MTLTIRDYQPGDLEACRALWAELVQHHRDIYEDQTIGGDDPGQWFDGHLKNPHRHGTWVAEQHGRVIGVASLLVSSDEEGEIDPVIVTAPERSRGTGEALVKHAVNAARKAGIRFLSIKPVARNSRAISLYVRLGFDILGLVDLTMDLAPSSQRKWRPGIRLHDNQLRY